MEEKLESHDIIKKAFRIVQGNLNIAPLQENEKHALRVLIDRLIAYYNRRLELMAKRGIDINSNHEKVILLKSFMSDILVDINNVQKGGIDVYYFVSVINKRINDKEVEKIVKQKIK